MKHTIHETIAIDLGEDLTNLQEKLSEYIDALGLEPEQEDALVDLVDALVDEAITDSVHQLVEHIHQDANDALADPARIIEYQVTHGTMNGDVIIYKRMKKY